MTGLDNEIPASSVY